MRTVNNAEIDFFKHNNKLRGVTTDKKELVSADQNPSSSTARFNVQLNNGFIDVYTLGRQVVADLSHVHSLFFVYVYDENGVIVQAIKSHGEEVLQINIPSMGMNVIQIQNGRKNFTQKVLLQ